MKKYHSNQLKSNSILLLCLVGFIDIECIYVQGFILESRVPIFPCDDSARIYWFHLYRYHNILTSTISLGYVHGCHPIEASVQYLNHVAPRILDVYTDRCPSGDLDCGALPTPSVLDDPVSQRIRTGIRHADVEETATVVFKVDGIRLEIRVDELEHFETDTVPGGHVCQLDFMKSFSVDGEDGS